MKQIRNADYALAYSSDRPLEKPCKKCGNLPSRCSCKSAESKSLNLSAQTAKVRLEKKGRAGKVVTVLYNLPGDSDLIKKLCSQLKKSLGCGGTAYCKDGLGFIELQGDYQNEALKLLLKLF